jgi:hypothetical protein
MSESTKDSSVERGGGSDAPVPGPGPATARNAGTPARPRRLARSLGALFLGFVAVVALSLGTDQALHELKVYPPWGQPMDDPGLNFLALVYRCVYGVAGSYLTARFAPHSPMRHALVGGAIGFVLSLAGALATMNLKLGPIWYPFALVATAMPCAWLGGVLHRNWRPTR